MRSGSLETLIHDEIRERGPMSFARFMELALYHPEWGYYARNHAARSVGREGDFYTSVSVGPLFGRLLARQFAQGWKTMGEPDPFYLVEFGGLDGQLAHDVLTSLQSDSPRCAEATRYLLVEPLPRLARQQKSKLANFSKVSWVEAVKQMCNGGENRRPTKASSLVNHPSVGRPFWPPSLEGIVFGNELLDSFPVHRLEFCKTEGESGKWMECCIALERERLTWTHQACPESWVASLPCHARGMTEHSPQAILWLQDVAGILKRGQILLWDYGWTDEEYFQVERHEGTLRGYQDHRRVADLLARPGEQDLTAHVRWTPLLEHARRLHLEVGEFIQQGRWLSRIVAENLIQPNPAEIRQFNALTHPEILGAPFRVLVLTKPES